MKEKNSLKIKYLTFSFALSFFANYLFIISLSLIEMITAMGKNEIYGDKSKGIFACDNFHGDLFYCSETEFLLTRPFQIVGFFAFITYGLTVIIPTIIFYFLYKRFLKNK